MYAYKPNMLVELIEGRAIYKTPRTWLDFLYVVSVTTRSTNFVLVILVVGNQFKISSLIVTRKGNHVMYIGHVYAQVGVLFLLSKGLVHLITSLRQTDKDQRIKIEERSEGNWARDRGQASLNEEEEEKKNLNLYL